MQLKVIAILLLILLAGCGARNPNKIVTESKLYPEPVVSKTQPEQPKNNDDDTAENQDCTMVFLSYCN